MPNIPLGSALQWAVRNGNKGVARKALMAQLRPITKAERSADFKIALCFSMMKGQAGIARMLLEAEGIKISSRIMVILFVEHSCSPQLEAMCLFSELSCR
ncbi:uncharacterized protein N7469_005106 [Penicillium citrinum]|uniref:Uncharacterized protein n=1 Tax=Penicillium citrinum TaxID=5077 RepID=A0A9W9P1G5_PENCI|nr:uncharacterized protein N7469_005106 [Penicillium citrinum]KAJ5233340.1 hypothetical protein N7469_005106 [Penicillium citrinum]